MSAWMLHFLDPERGEHGRGVGVRTEERNILHPSPPPFEMFTTVGVGVVATVKLGAQFRC